MKLVSPEMKNEIPAQTGKMVTNRITDASESGGTKTDGSSPSVFYLCYSRRKPAGKGEIHGKVFKL